jgi:hypothetical protein
LGALGSHRRSDADSGKIGHENVRRALAGQIGHDAFQRSDGRLDHGLRPGIADGSQQVVAAAVHDVKTASAGAGRAQIGAGLRPQAGIAGSGVEARSADGEVRSAHAARPEGQPEAFGQVLDPDRSVRGAPCIAVIRQAVAEDHDLIEGRHGLGSRAHEDQCCRYDKGMDETKHEAAPWRRVGPMPPEGPMITTVLPRRLFNPAGLPFPTTLPATLTAGS